MDMAFTREQAIKALKETDNNMERAVDWIFNHPNDLGGDDVVEEQPVGAGASGVSHVVDLTNGQPKYKLVAFISHMGTSHMVGHYVCHILKDGKWVIFNDSKVALSQNPPKGLGYLYLYQREDASS
jgi:ubiquitin carboxyl-terminal hydrolase 5/13